MLPGVEVGFEWNHKEQKSGVKLSQKARTTSITKTVLFIQEINVDQCGHTYTNTYHVEST